MRAWIAMLSIGAWLLIGGCKEEPKPESGDLPPAEPPPPPPPPPPPEPPIDPEFKLEIDDEQAAAAGTLHAAAEAVAAAPLPGNGTGCAPGARCIRVTQAGKPTSSSTASIAQCRGKFADFIVARNTIPAGYAGPWFQPNLIEKAHTGIPQGARPWRAIDPKSDPLKYTLALRNYAFASSVVRGLTPALTSNADYEDPSAGSVPDAQRGQKWYPAPRMIYFDEGPFGVREAAHGMTRERGTAVGGLGGNTVAFDNFAVGYYDARGARTFARTWKTSSPGVDSVDKTKMRFTKDTLVFKLLYSAARPSDFPTDILQGSQEVSILPRRNAPPVKVRLLQIDIAVKDERAGATGWYFATYAFDRNAAGASPWLKMTPVGLMWGNDPSGPPIVESWINPAAPQYAKDHLGVDGRLNGPVDNPGSACMSCHSTAQVPTLANMLGEGNCASQKAQWFRNLSGTTPFGRFDQRTPGCPTDLGGTVLTAADYSLQLSDTATRATVGDPSFNPCTWDTAAPVGGATPAPATAAPATAPKPFPVER